MAFKTVGGGGNRIDIKKGAKDKVYEGKFLGGEDINSKFGTQKLWNFKNKDGEFAVYGFAVLNRSLGEVKVGSLVRFKYTGTKFSEKQKRDIHMAYVEADDETAVEGEEVPF